jgi:SAM-dependent methyltransferase
LAETLISSNDLLIPGGNEQFKHLLELKPSQCKNALIIGTGCEPIAKKLSNYYEDVNIITDNYDSLIQSRVRVGNKIKIKLMDYSRTDFAYDYFDLIYAQGSLTLPARKNIIKEIKRILSAGGLLCAGEVIILKEPVPAFVKDIWDRNGLLPLTSSQIVNFYLNNGFELISEKYLTKTLKEYYTKVKNMISGISKSEIEENKKYFSQIKHESNAYLKLGGDKYIGFKSLIMRKLN